MAIRFLAVEMHQSQRVLITITLINVMKYRQQIGVLQLLMMKSEDRHRYINKYEILIIKNIENYDKFIITEAILNPTRV